MSSETNKFYTLMNIAPKIDNLVEKQLDIVKKLGDVIK